MGPLEAVEINFTSSFFLGLVNRNSQTKYKKNLTIDKGLLEC